MSSLIDNVNKRLVDDLRKEIKAGSKLSIAAASFSIYAFKELKAELEKIKEFRFIFTSEAFTTEKTPKSKREFYIPRLERERTLYGSEFEIKLRNELTQKAIARECAEWIKNKARFCTNISGEHIPGFICVDNIAYTPINDFTTVTLGLEKGNNAFYFINKIDENSNAKALLNNFEAIWQDKKKLSEVTETVLENITTVYNENAPELIYFVTLYNIFSEFLEDISEDFLANEAVGFKQSVIWNKLYNFQRDAVLAIINKLEKFNGCILADSVGLGKTFTALAVMKYYQERNKNILVLCPKKLSNNWNTFKDNYLNNPIAKDRMNYTVLYHTDLSRNGGFSNGIDLSRLNWSNYDLVVIDESHNFRNGGKLDEFDGLNRYATLLKNVIRKGVKTKVLMLSATPVNNKFLDLKNQLALAYEGRAELINEKLNTKHDIDEVFKQAQRAFTNWRKLPILERTRSKLLNMLDFDFFEVLDNVTIARSRKNVQKYYDTSEIGSFPKRLKPKSIRSALDLTASINFNQIYEILMKLNLAIYVPSTYILSQRVPYYAEKFGDNVVNIGLTQANRERGIQKLMAVGLLKRMESSVHSFRLTLKRVHELMETTIRQIDDFEKRHSLSTIKQGDIPFLRDLDDEEDVLLYGKKIEISLADMDYISWRRDIKKDIEKVDELLSMVEGITPPNDNKLKILLDEIRNKVKNPINNGNKKVLIFTAFADTAEYLYENISKTLLNELNLNTAMVTGSIEGRTTLSKFSRDANKMNDILTCFAPVAKEKHLLMPDDTNEIDILIATDCISEGQNLQDCDYLINYDIHWNPVRIIQRFGRIDRIGSKNNFIQLVNFWPDCDLDEYLNLVESVLTKMKLVNLTATGDENPIEEADNGDLAYRKAQLKKLHDEIVDIEDMSQGVSIMDLGLNEFRLDLLEYIKNFPDIDKVPCGMHTIIKSNDDAPKGVIFVLRNRETGINIDNKNQLHPFYMVYLAEDGSVVCNHLEPKAMLDKIRFLCKGKTKPISVMPLMEMDKRLSKNL